MKEGLINRKEFGECIETINDEQSFVITGNAGYGKSGCTEAILIIANKKIFHISQLN